MAVYLLPKQKTRVRFSYLAQKKKEFVCEEESCSQGESILYNPLCADYLQKLLKRAKKKR